MWFFFFFFSDNPVSVTPKPVNPVKENGPRRSLNLEDYKKKRGLIWDIQKYILIKKGLVYTKSVTLNCFSYFVENDIFCDYHSLYIYYLFILVTCLNSNQFVYEKICWNVVLHITLFSYGF